ncbi:sigma-70 family RNA polymerase sigma factor [Patescibacteria group bacterium]|nr:sigma-70 family RNA polymerase sigma factor [Patescibacteria group bacterium]
MDDLTLYTDEELLSLSLTNKRFFAAIVERYEKKLAAYIFRLGRLGTEDTEDLLQDIFLKVYQNMNNFDTQLKFSSWIYRIAHNETMGFFRHRKVRPHGHTVLESEKVLEVFASELNLVEDIEAQEASAHLNACINELPLKYRDSLVLKFFEHKTYGEISDILSLPEGTVATRINRAKEQVRKMMANKGYSYEQ